MGNGRPGRAGLASGTERERERERDAVLQSLYGHPSDDSDLSSSSSATDCRQVELT